MPTSRLISANEAPANLMSLKQVAGALIEADLEELNSFTDANNQVIRLVTLSNTQ